MRCGQLLAAVGASALLACAGAADADLIRFTFRGTITTVEGGLTPPPEVEVGAAFELSYIFDTATADADPAPNVGLYAGAVLTGSADIGGYVANTTGGFISVLDNGFAGDSYYAETGTDARACRVSLGDFQGQEIEGDALVDDLNLGGYELRNFWLEVNTGPAFWRAGGTIGSFERVVVPACASDFDGSGTVNSNDISAFLTAWLADLADGTLNADFDGSTVVDSNDISAFLTAWLGEVSGGC